MLLGKKIAVIMPAYNAEKTLERTHQEIPHDIVDWIVLVDDCSQDQTVRIAKSLQIIVVCHEENRGYGGNQKTCYAEATNLGADIVVMLHPDYQYTPKLIRAMVSLIAEGVYDVVLGSRILGLGINQQTMPRYKYIANRSLTLAQNLMIGQKLSEYHTGLRAFNQNVLNSIHLELNSDDFLFDNEILVQCHAAGYRIAEISTPTQYFDEASSINFSRSVRYGLGCLWVSLRYLLHRTGIHRFQQFSRRVEGLSSE